MKFYKHYSFDLWGTLLVSNPEFKRKRAEMLQKNFNSLGLTVDQVFDEITIVDRMVNQVNEMIGNNIDAYEMYAMVLSKINSPEVFKAMRREDIAKVYDASIAIFHNYLPTFTQKNLLEDLQKIKSEKRENNVTFSVLSNTGFIKGSEMRYILKILGVAWLMDFEIYSDEVGYSKPNTIIFETLFSKASYLHSEIDLCREDIIHIGDSVEADCNGAVRAGFNAELIQNAKNMKYPVTDAILQSDRIKTMQI